MLRAVAKSFQTINPQKPGKLAFGDQSVGEGLNSQTLIPQRQQIGTAGNGPQAQLLLAQAHQLEKEGRLLEARDKVVEAQKLGVVFGVHEETPEQCVLTLGAAWATSSPAFDSQCRSDPSLFGGRAGDEAVRRSVCAPGDGTGLPPGPPFQLTEYYRDAAMVRQLVDGVVEQAAQVVPLVEDWRDHVRTSGLALVPASSRPCGKNRHRSCPIPAAASRRS